MATEIERKFLVRDDRWRAQAESAVRLRQGYLSRDAAASIRVRVAGDSAFLNIKSATVGISRREYEYPIPLDEANELLEELCLRPLIDKTRHHIRFEGRLWEVDEFHGDNEGLVVAEIELAAEGETFPRPDWLGEDVSHDPRYYNVALVKHPFKDWS